MGRSPSLPAGRRAKLLGLSAQAAAMGGGTANLLFPLFFPPTVISVSPAVGDIGGGTVVVIAGLNFRTGATVLFDGLAATAVVVSPNSITCTTPAHALGAVNVTITNTDLQSSTLVNGFAYQGVNYVIVGKNAAGTAGLALWSIDGVTWQAGTGMPAFWPKAVASNGVLWVAVGTSLTGTATTIAAYSTDGKAWHAATIASGLFVSIAFGDVAGVFVASQNAAFIHSTPDGINWTAHAVPVFAANPLNVAWTGAQFIVDSTSSDSWTSPDGLIWAHSILRATAGPGGGNGYSGAWSGAVFADCDAGNVSPLFQLTPDGAAWSSFSATGAHGTTKKLAWNGVVFSSFGTAALYTAPAAGTPWTFQGAAPAGGPYAAYIADGAGIFIAVGTNIIAKSSDGVSFTSAALPAGVWTGIAWHT